MAESMSAKVLNMIQDDIISGNLKEGEIISERSLVERYNVSRTPIKEAFIILEREGWIEISPRQETRITNYGLKELQEMLPIRLLLEALAVTLCIQNMDSRIMAECTRLQKDLRQMKEKLLECKPGESDGCIEQYNELDSRVHNLYYQNCNNKTLVYYFEHMMSVLKRTYRCIPLEYERMLSGSDELLHVVTCTVERDSVLAEVHIKRHILNSYLQKAAFFASRAELDGDKTP